MCVCVCLLYCELFALAPLLYAEEGKRIVYRKLVFPIQKLLDHEELYPDLMEKTVSPTDIGF